MVFSSLVFLYAFLPLVLVSYFLFRSRVYRNLVLLLFSLLFYAWGEPKYIVLMVLACVCAYICGLFIERFRERPRLKRMALICGIVLLIGNLLVFKYAGFFTSNLHVLFSEMPIVKLALPIGISFYTFQILSYLIDLYRGSITVQRNPFYLALYVSLFPQLIAGPIVRYQTVETEIRDRHETVSDAAAGMRRFILGLAKKVLIANNVAAVAELIYAGDAAVYGTAMYWVAAIAYTLQIYFDFSGYSDMAIGLGRVFGFHFLENFEHPYIARSITDFWRRWHISLSSWFRDYVYIPLGGNRVSRVAWVRNLLLVWCLTGFWHGAEWNFILWGLYYGLLLLAEKLVLARVLRHLPNALQWLYAMFFVVMGWVLFNMTDPSQLLSALKIMFVYVPTRFSDMLAADTSIVKALLYIPLGCICSFPLLKKLPKLDGALWLLVKNIACGALFIVCITVILSSTFNPFIYFRF